MSVRRLCLHFTFANVSLSPKRRRRLQKIPNGILKSKTARRERRDSGEDVVDSAHLALIFVQRTLQEVWVLLRSPEHASKGNEASGITLEALVGNCRPRSG